MLLAPGQQAERDGIGEHAHADAMYPDPASGGRSDGRQACAGQHRHQDKQHGGKRNAACRDPGWVEAVECQFDTGEGTAPDHAQKGEKPSVQWGRRLFFRVHQVTALRAWNSGLSQRRSFMMAAILSTACHTSAKLV